MTYGRRQTGGQGWRWRNRRKRTPFKGKGVRVRKRKGGLWQQFLTGLTPCVIVTNLLFAP